MSGDGPPKPPAGSLHDSRNAQQVPLPGQSMDSTRDPFLPPTRPLGPGSKAVASIVYRDLPLVTIGTDWDVESVRGALRNNMTGLFDAPAQLVDAVLKHVDAVGAGGRGGVEVHRQVIPRGDAAEARWPLN